MRENRVVRRNDTARYFYLTIPRRTYEVLQFIGRNLYISGRQGRRKSHDDLLGYSLLSGARTRPGDSHQSDFSKK